MFDLYQILVPAFAIITLLNLLVLKLALRDNVTLSKIYNKKKTTELMLIVNQEQSAAKLTLKFMFLNFTPLEFFIVRRARYKTPFFTALSIIAIASYFTQIPFAFTFIGSISYFAYFLIAMLSFKSQQEQANTEQSKIYGQKYLQVIFVIISIVINVIIIGLLYKNYKNSVLTAFISQACVNIALDNFIARPVLIVLIGLPISRSITIANYVNQCQKQLNLLQIYDEMGQRKMLFKDGKQISPRKIPVDLQIEPPIYHQKAIKYVDILKKIKKDRTLTPILNKAARNIECQLSIDSLFNSNKIQEDPHLYQDPLQNEKNKEYAENYGSFAKKKSFRSENIIMVNPSLQQQVQNEEDIATQQPIKAQTNQEPDQKCDHSETIGYGIRNNGLNFEQDQPAKISINSSSQPTSRQQPLSISLNAEIKLDLHEHFQKQEDIETDKYRKRKDLQAIEQGSNRNTYGVLEIKQQNHIYHPSEQIQEIDLNSPQRKKRSIQIQLQQECKFGVVQRKKKKFSVDHGQNRVIKFSTGEPYLQYLPKMLIKDSKILSKNMQAKKLQVISKKDIMTDIRASNSIKHPKKRIGSIQNNENAVPEFRIQEL